MPKFIIRWNIGYGDSHAIIEAESLDDAIGDAYDEWREESENNSDYDAEPYSKELAVEYGLESDDEEDS